MDSRECLLDFSPDGFAVRLKELFAVPAFRARQVFDWVYKKGAGDFGAMSDLPAELRKQLTERFDVFPFTVERRVPSDDGTIKYLYRLRDGNAVEGVLIGGKRRTVCVSTQVGCAFGCAFCQSGAEGFVRNLVPAEIVGQALFVKNEVGATRESPTHLTNLVFMGMGEPLANYDNLLVAIRALNSKAGADFGARRMTISTAGLAKEIRRLAEEGLQIRLSVSLHAATDVLRDRLMPVNRKYPLSELIAACQEYEKRCGRIVTFEYIMIRGVNDREEDRDALVRLANKLQCKVNLVPFNPTSCYPGAPSVPAVVRRFESTLRANGVTATIREKRGDDISAACGQLRFVTKNHA